MTILAVTHVRGTFKVARTSVYAVFDAKMLYLLMGSFTAAKIVKEPFFTT
ncbi:MAG: hypothetical protein U5L45_09825 [Saprospiraceae bacterium]|nr:hypothetical protein [Saprospiraceae bacterium]